MKTNYIFTLLFISTIIISLNTIQAQEGCAVLKEEISGTYEGDCKKGLADGEGKASGIDQYEGEFKKGFPHGQGTYVWKSGDTYTGGWKKGEMSGKGTMHIVSGDRDTTYTGIWNQDEYEGPEVKKPQIRQNVGVDRYSFNRVAEGNRLLVNIYMNGMPNTSATNFTINTSSGIQSKRSNTYIFEEVSFPVECILRYKTWNKLHTAEHDVIFNFVIDQEGEWEVDIHN
ncbi:MAG: hypothetical protein KDC09_17330 [Bacteroidales bacterium]|nr:hypothetical protein [Bacteroidales bacterium]